MRCRTLRPFSTFIEKGIFSFVPEIYLHLFMSSTTTVSNKIRLANAENPKQIPIIRTFCDLLLTSKLIEIF